jgi:hypothetical protein
MTPVSRLQSYRGKEKSSKPQPYRRRKSENSGDVFAIPSARWRYFRVPISGDSHTFNIEIEKERVFILCWISRNSLGLLRVSMVGLRRSWELDTQLTGELRYRHRQTDCVG